MERFCVLYGRRAVCCISNRCFSTTVPELKDRLRELGLKVTGNKNELQTRLNEHLGLDNAVAETSPKKSTEYKLIVAEKPSVAIDIKNALGLKNVKGVYKGVHYIVAHAAGHLLQLSNDEEVKGKWKLENLPAVPSQFSWSPIKSNTPLLRDLQKLGSSNVIEVINACDAGREGELIFESIRSYLRWDKLPYRRMWLKSMTPESIREAIENLRSEEEMKPLLDAAKSRAESDWLVGINCTRAASAIVNTHSTGFHTVRIGRVQTPTLSLIVQREKEIENFVPRPLWHVSCVFGNESGQYRASYLSKSTGKQEILEEEELKTVMQVVKRENNPKVVVKDVESNGTRSAPKLFNISAIQKEMQRKHGVLPITTSRALQSLYLHHKIISYPRTDSRCLPSNYKDYVKQILESAVSPGRIGKDIADLVQYEIEHHFSTSNNSNSNNFNGIFDNDGVTDHHAIIPVSLNPSTALTSVEKTVYFEIVRRLLAAFLSPAIFQQVVRTSTVEDKYAFVLKSQTLVDPGWMQAYPETVESYHKNTNLKPMQGKISVLQSEVVEGKTSPPNRFTDSSLLTAMEHAGKHVDDEDLKAAIKKCGLGTAATRSSVIQELIDQDNIQRVGSELLPTHTGRFKIETLQQLGLEELTSPILTAQWEQRLQDMEQRRADRSSFMKDIRKHVTEMIDCFKKNNKNIPISDVPLDNVCSKCQSKIYEYLFSFQCSKCDFRVLRHHNGRALARSEVEVLLKGETLTDTDSAGKGRSVGLTTDGVRYVQPIKSGSKIGECPRCQGDFVFYHNKFVCMGKEDGSAKQVAKLDSLLDNPNGEITGCGVAISRKVMGHHISVEEIVQLIQNGKTSPLWFYSKNRRFQASILLTTDGQVRFEFLKKNEDKQVEK